ncbi:MAG: cation:proton antiporter, partial [Chitinophagaceae bacterium]
LKFLFVMSYIVIAVCVLLLLAYVFDITASKTRIPSVILLLVLGWATGQLSNIMGLNIPDLNQILPVLGTIGLILIVLEGALELEITASKKKMIFKSFLMALFPMLVLALGLAFAFSFFQGIGFQTALLNALPLSVISSAIAIPSARYLKPENKEFVTYESSLSDILGVLFFNFVIVNDQVSVQSVGIFVFDVVLILIVSVISALVLMVLLGRIKHHVKFVPIILMVLIVYYVAKIYHLPALIFILLFGILLGNLDVLKSLKFANKLHSEVLKREVHRFHPLVSEITFLIRALFFLVFGFLIQTSELLNVDSILWAAAITLSIFVVRALFLKIMKLQVLPLLFVAPRGLITILLFLTIPASHTIALSNKSLIIQVIVLCALVMMFGLMYSKSRKEK